jgi:hypothetical protein
MEKLSDEVAMLVGQAGPLNGQRFALRKDMTLGREAGCEIMIPDRQVSRHHARITVKSEGIFLEDLASKNGTHHNGKLISESVLLQDGDAIQVALVQKFIYLSSDATLPLDMTEAAHQSALDTQTGLPVGRLHLEKRSRRVWVTIISNETGQEVEILPPLSASQYRLLELLYQNQGRVVTRQDLVAAVWGDEQTYAISEQALDALVRRLRERISSVDPDHAYLVTVRGHGIRLDNPPH